jgi:hypothetical protein
MRISSRVISRQYANDVGLMNRLGATAVTPVSFLGATTPACPSCAEIAAPSRCTASVSTRRPGSAPRLITIWPGALAPSGETQQYATVVMPTPPAANARWNSIRSSVTKPSGERPSDVAALMTLLRSVNGPSWTGPNGSGDSARIPPPLPDAGPGQRCPPDSRESWSAAFDGVPSLGSWLTVRCSSLTGW